MQKYSWNILQQPEDDNEFAEVCRYNVKWSEIASLCFYVGGWMCFTIYVTPVWYNLPMKLVRLMKMRLNEAYSKVRISTNLSGPFAIQNGLKQGDALSSLLYNFALVCTIRKVQVREWVGHISSWCVLTILPQYVRWKHNTIKHRSCVRS
jgi:hypothetical protein